MEKRRFALGILDDPKKGAPGVSESPIALQEMFPEKEYPGLAIALYNMKKGPTHAAASAAGEADEADSPEAQKDFAAFKTGLMQSDDRETAEYLQSLSAALGGRGFVGNGSDYGGAFGDLGMLNGLMPGGFADFGMPGFGNAPGGMFPVNGFGGGIPSDGMLPGSVLPTGLSGGVGPYYPMPMQAMGPYSGPSVPRRR